MSDIILENAFQPQILVDAFFCGIELEKWLEAQSPEHPQYRRALVRTAELLVYGHPERSLALVEKAKALGISYGRILPIIARCRLEKGENIGAENILYQLSGPWKTMIHARIAIQKNEIDQGMDFLQQLIDDPQTPKEVYAEALLFRMQRHARHQRQAKTMACYVKLRQFAQESKAQKTIIWLAMIHQLFGGNPAADRLFLAIKLSELYSQALAHADCKAEDIAPIPLALHSLLRQTKGSPQQAGNKLAMMITLEARLERKQEAIQLAFWGEKLLGKLYSPKFAQAIANISVQL